MEIRFSLLLGLVLITNTVAISSVHGRQRPLPVEVTNTPEVTVTNLGEAPIPVSVAVSGQPVTIARASSENLNGSYEVPSGKALIVDLLSVRVQTEARFCDDPGDAEGALLQVSLASQATDGDGSFGAAFFLGEDDLVISSTSSSIGFWRFSRSVPGLHQGFVFVSAGIINKSPCKLSGPDVDSFFDLSIVGRLVDVEP
jgi:hypothetical protein